MRGLLSPLQPPAGKVYEKRKLPLEAMCSVMPVTDRVLQHLL